MNLVSMLPRRRPQRAWFQRALAAVLLAALAGSAGWVCSAWAASARLGWQAPAPGALPCTRTLPAARLAGWDAQRPDPLQRPCRPWA